MSENVRALFFVLVLSGSVFWFGKRALADTVCAGEDFARRRNLWFAITIVAFLMPSFWVYILLAGGLLLYGRSKEKNWLAMYFALIFVLPGIDGMVPKLVRIDITVLIGMTVLLPAYFVLRRRQGVTTFGTLLPDILILSHVLLALVMRMRATTVTDALRSNLFGSTFDTLLPYYVITRGAGSLKELREALGALVVTAGVFSLLAIFENQKHWLLYNGLASSLRGAMPWPWSYLARNGGLRAVVTAGQPIPLGTFLIVGLACLFYLKSHFTNVWMWRAAVALVLGGLIATVSRGPWVGSVAMVLVFIATGPAATSNLMKFGLAGGAVFAGLLLSPLGDSIVDLIPFVGTVEPQNAEYRKLFIQQSIPAMMHHPWFGTPDYVYLPEFDNLKPQGLLDTLNVFITVALERGLVGLAIFAGLFVSVGLGVYGALRRAREFSEEHYLLGRALLGALAGVTVTLNTTSPITIIGNVSWLVIGLGVAYILLVRRETQAIAKERIRKRAEARQKRATVGR